MTVVVQKSFATPLSPTVKTDHSTFSSSGFRDSWYSFELFLDSEVSCKGTGFRVEVFHTGGA